MRCLAQLLASSLPFEPEHSNASFRTVALACSKERKVYIELHCGLQLRRVGFELRGGFRSREKRGGFCVHICYHRNYMEIWKS